MKALFGGKKRKSHTTSQNHRFRGVAIYQSLHLIVWTNSFLETTKGNLSFPLLGRIQRLSNLDLVKYAKMAPRKNNKHRFHSIYSKGLSIDPFSKPLPKEYFPESSKYLSSKTPPSRLSIPTSASAESRKASLGQHLFHAHRRRRAAAHTTAAFRRPGRWGVRHEAARAWQKKCESKRHVYKRYICCIYI